MSKADRTFFDELSIKTLDRIAKWSNQEKIQRLSELRSALRVAYRRGKDDQNVAETSDVVRTTSVCE